MLKRYRYRAYPTGEQARAAARTFGCARVVFNDFLARRRDLRQEGRHREVPFSETVKDVTTRAKLTPERAWLSEVSNTPLQQSVRDAERAYRNWFDSLSGKRKGRRMGFPRFKSRRDHRQSVRFTRNSRFSVRETTHGVGFVRLPKVGEVRFALSRPLPSEPSSVTLIRSASGVWHVSFVVEVPDPDPLPKTGRVAGIDLGLTDLAAIAYSDGTREKVASPRHLRAKERKLARAQRELARRRKGSANRAKSRVKVARIHEKVAATRLDHHHKLASRLVRENQAIGLETLSITGLARTRLARSIHDAGWGTLVRLIEEKAREHGRTVVREDRFSPTTRTCSICGVIGGKKPLSVREWQCEHCETWLDRDYNAATNIMVAAGRAETENACGGDVRRQPDRALRLCLASAVPAEAGTRRTDQVA